MERDSAENVTWTIARWLSRAALILFVPAAIVLAVRIVMSGVDGRAIAGAVPVLVAAPFAVRQCAMRRRAGYRW